MTKFSTLEERKPIWLALSEFYLDTELVLLWQFKKTHPLCPFGICREKDLLSDSADLADLADRK